MADLPSASTTVSTIAQAIASGQDLVCIFAPVPSSADAVPRIYGSAAAVHSVHGYSEGLEYVALHSQDTRKAVLFCGLPIATPGVIGREDTSGNTDTCTTTLSAGASGVLTEHDGRIDVVTGGTIGTDQILLSLSLDGGTSFRRVRLGTATSYVIPYVGVTVSFGAGDLTAGDTIHTWHGSGPRSDSDGWAAARAALASQQKQHRSILLCGDLQNSTEANAFNTQLDAYETSNARYVYGRASVRDRAPLATLSTSQWTKQGSPSLTFADATDTITRASGSWVSDGAAVGDQVVVSGTADNDGTYIVTVVTALVLTLESGDLADEVTANAAISGQPTLTFANSGETITRSRGSWLNDGFRVGTVVDIDGTSGGTNDGTFEVQTVTALVLTLDTGDVDADEVIGVNDLSLSGGQTKAEWMAEVDAAFAAVDARKRIDLSAGRGRVYSPFTGWYFRRPAAWAASLREFVHDVHITTWRKSDGPTAFLLHNAAGELEEWDDRDDGGAGSAARFTTFRTYANGPVGAFIARSLTRDTEGSVLSQTHNVAVTDIACTIAQAGGENFLGRTPILNANGTATEEELKTLEQEINSSLSRELLANKKGEGQRASYAVWTAARDDDLGAVDATLNGVLELRLRGTIVHVNTVVRATTGEN